MVTKNSRIRRCAGLRLPLLASALTVFTLRAGAQTTPTLPAPQAPPATQSPAQPAQDSLLPPLPAEATQQAAPNQGASTQASQVFPGAFPTFPATTGESIPAPAAAPQTVTPKPTTPYADLEIHSPYSDYGVTDDAILTHKQMYGALNFELPTSILPEYYYRPDYYETSGIGARPIADYAPAGYETREYESAPGEPLFSPITPPPRPTSAAANNFVTRGMMPGSFLVPGTNTSFRFRGLVRLAAMEDLQPIGTPDSFVTNAIRVPQTRGQNFNMSGRISRFGFDTWTPTAFKEWNVHTFIEGDFFNGAGQAAGGGGNPFRLRHAFIDFGYFRFGQQNSVFMDGNNWPSLVDFQGPNSWVNQRQPSARMTLPVADRLFWATSFERPFSDITTNGLGANAQDIPDMATHVRYEGDVGHLQVSGVLRTIEFDPTGGDRTRRTGGGVCGSLVVHPWAYLMGGDPVHEANPSGLTRSRILLMAEWGPGLGRYVNDLAGQGLDGQVDPVTGEFNLVESLGWNASYEHWYSENWLSNFTFANVLVDNNPGQPATTYDSTRYVAGSLWWIPVPRLSFGIEYLYGQRENIDNQHAQSQRIGGLVQYNF
jgi:hypothetical protein